MAWTISSRLTFMFSALTGAIMAVVGVLSFWTIQTSVEQDAVAAVQHVADRVAQSIMRQLDEDLLVDFGGEKVSFRNLKVESDYWAVVRQDQRIEFASDALLMAGPHGARRIDDILTRVRPEDFWVATVPLLQEPGFGIADLPPAVLDTVTAAAPGSRLLNAKREVSGDRNVISIKVLDDHRIVEVKVTERGEWVGQKNEPFVERLPPGLLDYLPAHRRLHRVDRLSWSAYNGQLVAVIEGRLADGRVARVAMNRLGEELHVDASGTVTGKIGASALQLLVVSSAAEDRRKMVAALALILGGGTGAWIAVSMVGWFVTRRALSPVGEIVRTVNRIQLSDLEQRLPGGGADDELSRLASTINAMLDRIRDGYLREQQFVADAAHELTGPLSKIIGDIEVALSQTRDNAEYRDVLQRLWRYAEELQRLVESLLLLARIESQGEHLRFETIDIVELIFDLVSTLRPQDGERVLVEVDETGEVMVLGERELIRVLLRNLIDNALRYSPQRESVQVKIRLDRARAEVDIIDQGPGISDAEASKLFNRFYRVDNTRTREAGGFGLGLAIVRAIAAIHEAGVEFRRGVAAGTVVSVQFRVQTVGPPIIPDYSERDAG